MSTYTLVRSADGMPVQQISGLSLVPPQPPEGHVWVEAAAAGANYRWDFGQAAWQYAGPNTEQLEAEARARRDAELVQSDRTQLPDFPITTQKRAEWSAHRQALRDLTLQEGFPTSISWPVPPAG